MLLRAPPPPPPGAKTFLLVTDNKRSRLDSPFCVITQHRKFEFGHHRQSISNAQELTMQLSQTLSSAIAQIKVSNYPVTNHTKKILPSSFLSCLPHCFACCKTYIGSVLFRTSAYTGAKQSSRVPFWFPDLLRQNGLVPGHLVPFSRPGHLVPLFGSPRPIFYNGV